MKKIFSVIIMAGILIISLTSCSKVKSPIDEVNDFNEMWTKTDYISMYDKVTIENKKNITEEDFNKAYKDFYEAIGLKKVTVTNMANEEELKEKIKKEESITIPISIQIETTYGQKSYNRDVVLLKENIDDDYVWNIKWDYQMIYDGMEQGDTVKTANILPKRGKILDRNDNTLALNGEIIQVGIVPGRLGDMKEEIISDLAKTFSISEDYINERLNLSWVKEDSFVDLIKISVKDQYLIDEIYDKNNGATYKELNDRVYPYGELVAHLTGYLGYINEEELKILGPLGFTSNTKVGRNGLEKIYEEQLRGIPGKIVSIIDKDGQDKEILLEEKVQDGEDIKISIDIDRQAELFTEIGEEEEGTAACMNYQTGEVLALVSTPSYDPNEFILGMNNEEYNELINDEREPLLNRFSKVYAPGSSFKPITLAIALNEKFIDETFTIDVKGLDWQKDSSWGNYFITRVFDPGTHVDIEKAVIYSDNIYFAQVALKIGSETFLEKAKEFGIGEELSLAYGIAKSQLATNDSISKDELLADSGYGQGQVQVSILNLTKAYSTFVNSGNVVEPKLIMDEGEIETSNIISEEVANEIFELMRKVVEDSRGTGHDAMISGKVIAGKTGTAEIGIETEETSKKELGWFAAIDKSDETPYITAMMIENVEDRGGSHFVVPKVRDFIKGY
jgi:penicillin-binding protein